MGNGMKNRMRVWKTYSWNVSFVWWMWSCSCFLVEPILNHGFDIPIHELDFEWMNKVINWTRLRWFSIDVVGHNIFQCLVQTLDGWFGIRTHHLHFSFNVLWSSPNCFHNWFYVMRHLTNSTLFKRFNTGADWNMKALIDTRRSCFRSFSIDAVVHNLETDLNASVRLNQ